MTAELHSILKRLDQVERQNRRLKRAVIGSILAIGLLLLLGAQRASNAPSEQSPFSLRDSSGKDRAKLTMGDEGPVFQFFDANGDLQATFGTLRQGLAIRLLGGRGGLQTGLSLEPLGVAIVSYDASARPLVGANALKSDAGILSPGARANPRPERP